MAWLAAGSLLLALALLAPGAPDRPVRIAALALLLAGFAWSFFVYRNDAPPVLVGGALLLALLLVRLAGRRLAPPLRLAAAAAGTAMVAFSVLGPAEGLF